MVLLDAASDPDRVSNVKRRIINDFQLAPGLAKESKILGGKCFYDLAARWVNMVVDI